MLTVLRQIEPTKEVELGRESKEEKVRDSAVAWEAGGSAHGLQSGGPGPSLL